MRKLLLIVVFLYSALTSMPAQTGPAVSSRNVATEKFTIHYRVNNTEIDSTYLNNGAQLRHILDYLENPPKIDSITIYSWASPEGTYNRNMWLSQERGKAALRFILENVPDSTILNSSKVHLSPVAENWTGLLEKVEAEYNRHDREKVLNTLKAEDIGDETRKWRLKQLDGGYTWDFLVRRFMAELRSSTWICVWAPLPEPIEPAPSVEEPVSSVVEEQVPVDTVVYVDPVTPAEPEVLTETPSVPERRTVVALKTNLLYDAVTALNYSVEVPFNEKFSFLVEQHTPWWEIGNKYCLQILTLGGEFRWWFAPRTSFETESRKLRDALVGHFVGVHAWSGMADVQWKRNFGCYQFDFFSAGLTYGYSMPISRYLNLEFSISAGYARIPYQHYIPTEDWSVLIKDKYNAGTLHYFGPTKAEVSLVIPIRATCGRKGGER